MANNTTVIDITARVNDQTTTGVNSARRNLSGLEQSIRSMQTTLSRVQSGQVTVKATLHDMASSGLRSITTLGDRMVGKAWSVTANLIDNVTAPLRNIASMVASPITQMVALTGVTMGVADSVSTYMGFEQSMANTKAVTGADDATLQLIENEARRLGALTAYSAAEAGSTATILGQAGWSAEAIVSGLEGLMNLAAAGDVSLDTATEVTAKTISQWKMDAEDSNTSKHVADVLAKTTSSSYTDVAGLGETFKYAGGLAGGTLGFALEDVAIASGLMGNAGVEGSSAGTSLANLMTTLVSPTDSAAEALNNIGVSLTDSSGEMNNFLDIMRDFRSGMGNMTEDEKAWYASTIAGAEGLKGLTAIVNATEEEFLTLVESIYGAEGAASEMAAIRMDTLQGDILSFQSAVDEVKISIGERLAPTLRALVQYATSKMPDVGNAIQSAMDWADYKIQDFTVKVTTLTETEEWGNSSFTEKITLAWDTLVADPFSEWWEQDGQRYAINMADNAGTFLGGIVNGGLLTILGFDVGDAASDGMLLGKTFFTSFMEQIDVNAIASGMLSAAGSVVKEASQLINPFEEASAASYLAAGVTGYAGAKVVGATASAMGVGSSIVDFGRTLFGGDTNSDPINSNTNTSNNNNTNNSNNSNANDSSNNNGNNPNNNNGDVRSNSSLSTVSKTLSFFDVATNALSGAANTEAWTGSNSIGSTVTSSVAAVVGGTGDGWGEGNFWSNALDTLTHTATSAGTGFAVGGVGGALVGGATGLVGSMFGGENIAKFASGLFGKDDEKTSTSSASAVTEVENTKTALMEDLKTEMTTAVAEMEENVVSSVEDNSELLGDSVGTILEETLPTAMEESLLTAVDSSGTVLEDVFSVFFCETIPTYMEEMFLALEDTLTEQLTLSSETMMEDLGLFFGETMPSFFTGLWTGLEESLMEQSTLANEEINLANSLFFAETLPLSFQNMWLTVEESLAEQSLLSATSITERSGLFLEEFLPTSMDNLWITTESTILEQSLLSQNIINTGVVEFYGIYIPSSIQKIWDCQSLGDFPEEGV